MTELTGNNQIADVASGSDTRIRLDPEAKILIDGNPYVVVTLDETTSVLRRVDRPRVFASFTDAELQDLNARGRLIQDREGLSLVARSLQYNPEITFWNLDEDIADLVVFRTYFCDRFLAMELNGLTSRGDASMEVALSHIYASWIRLISEQDSSRRHFYSQRPIRLAKCPRPRTVRHWLRKYEAGDCRAMALCPQQYKRIIWSR